MDNQYLQLVPEFKLALESFNWIEIDLYFIKLRTEIEVVGLRLSPYFKFSYDIITYSDICLATGFEAGIIELNIFPEIDIYQCNYGLVGFIYWILI